MSHRYQPGGQWVGRLGCGLGLFSGILITASWVSGDLEKAQPAVLLLFIGMPLAVLTAVFLINTRD